MVFFREKLPKVLLMVPEIRRSPVELGNSCHYLRCFSTSQAGAGVLNHQQYDYSKGFCR